MDALHVQLDLFLTGGTYHNATCRYANYVHPEQPLYPARITGFSISSALPDLLLGGMAKRSASITLSDRDLARMDAPTLAAILATENPKGKRARVRLWDPTTNTTVSTLQGIISSLGQDYCTLTIEGDDPALMQTLLPVSRALDYYPSLDTSTLESKDPPPIVAFGPMPRVTLGCALATTLTFTATMGGAESNKFVYADLTDIPNYGVAAGDRLVYDIRHNGAGQKQSIDLRCSDGTVLRATTATDQNEVAPGPGADLDAYASAQWYRRDIDLTVLVGKTITEYMLGGENDTADTYGSFVANAYILDADEGKKVVIFDETILTAPFAYQSRNSTSSTVILTVNRQWDYGPIRPPATGTLTALAVYVDGRVRETSAYTFITAHGWRWVRFTKRPLASQGGPGKVQIDLNSTEFGRNPANLQKFIWADATMLNQTVNAASFTAAAAVYTGIGDYLKLVGGLAERKSALQLLRDVNFRGAYFDRNDTGEITVVVDAATQHPAAPVNLGQNDDLNLRNAEVETNNSLSNSIADQIKQLDFLAYRDPGLGSNGQASYLISATRSRAIGGATVTRESPYCGAGKMADREAGYLFKALVTNDLDIEARTGVTIGKQLALGQLLNFYSPQHYFSGSQFLVRRIKYDGSNFTLELIGWDTTLFTYTPGKVTVSRLVDALIDYSQTTPSTPTSPTYVSSTVTTSTDGNTISIEKFRVTLPLVNCTELRVLAYRTGIAQAIPFASVNKTNIVLGAANDIEIEVPAGLTYDIEFYAYNGNNLAEYRYSLPALITGRTTAGDTADPDTVVLTSCVGHNQRQNLLTWDAATAGDRDEYRIYRQAIANLVQNYGFEKLGGEDWTPSGSPGGGESVIQSTFAAHSGVRGLHIITTGTSLAWSQVVTVTNGATYTFAGWMRVTVFSAGAATLRINTGTGTLIDVIVGTAVGEWVFGYTTFVAAASTVTLSCRVATASSLTVHFDNIMLVAGTPTVTALIGEVKATRYTDTDAFVIGSSYWYAVSTVDRSENESAKSNFLAVPPVQIANEDLPGNLPLALTGLNVTDSAAYQTGDGATLAFMSLAWTNPADTKRAYVEVAYRRNGNTTSYLIADQVTGTTARVDDLSPGLGYDLRVRGVSHTGYFGPAATLTNQIAANDLTIPDAPVLTSCVGHNQRSTLITWDAATAGDRDEYRVYRQTMTNMVQNFGFETLGFANWTPTGTPGGGEVNEQSVFGAHSGAYGLRIVTTGTALERTQGVAVTNGATYTVGVWQRVTVRTAGSALFQINTGNGTIVNVSVVSAVTGWVWYYATFVATGTTATLICRAGVSGNLTVHFDNALLVSGTPTITALIGEVKTTRYTDTEAFVIGSSYWYAVSTRDRSENESAKSNSLAITPVQIANEDLPGNLPLALTGLSVTGSGTYQTGDGTTLAFVSLSWANPVDTKRAYVEVAYRRGDNNTSYLIADQVTGTTARVDDLSPGLPYDYRVRGVSHTGYFGPAASLMNQVAPGDTTAPATVTGLALVGQPPRSIRARWNAGSESDLSYYEVQRWIAGTFPGGAVMTEADTNEFTATGLGNGENWVFRVRAKDYSGNPIPDTGWSATASLVVPRTATDDNEDDSITTVKIGNLAVTNAKIGNLAVTNAKINDLSAAKITTGLLTVNPSTGGATAIFVDNAGKIRLKSIVGTPSKIVFEDASAVEQIVIGGTLGGLTITPITNNTNNVDFGDTTHRLNGVHIQANNFTVGGTSVVIEGTSGLTLLGQLRTDQVESSTPTGVVAATVPNRRLALYDGSGTFRCWLWGSS